MTFKSRCITPYQTVSKAAIRKIHEGTLEVLAEIGVKFTDSEALRFLEEHGCSVDFKKQVVKFPPDLVKRCLKK